MVSWEIRSVSQSLPVTPRRRENGRWAGPCGLASLVCPPDRLFSGQTWPALLVTVSRGSHGTAVKAVQEELNARVTPYGYQNLQVAVDGRFGPMTDAAVRAFQALVQSPYYGVLVVDGIVGTPHLVCADWRRITGRLART